MQPLFRKEHYLLPEELQAVLKKEEGNLPQLLLVSGLVPLEPKLQLKAFSRLLQATKPLSKGL